eukprot:4268867-Amphidinium_carterae.1
MVMTFPSVGSCCRAGSWILDARCTMRPPEMRKSSTPLSYLVCRSSRTTAWTTLLRKDATTIAANLSCQCSTSNATTAWTAAFSRTPVVDLGVASRATDG